MLEIDKKDLSIHINRGDVGIIEVRPTQPDDEEEPYVFKAGDIVRLTVTEAKKHDSVVLVKEVDCEEGSTSVDIYLNSSDTKIGKVINTPKDYEYEIELNPDTDPQTFIGYDRKGPKIFRLYPEAERRDQDE